MERLLNKKSADVPFLVQVLHLVNDSDEIFNRDYLYRRPAKAKPAVSMPLMNNADGFYNNLPQLQSAKGKHGRSQMRLTKAQKDAMQLQILQHRQFEIANKIAALRAGGAGGENAGGDNNNSRRDGEGSGGGSGSGSGHEEGEEEKEEQPGSRPNIIGNAEEMEAEQQEMNASGSGPNVASPFVRMQAQDPVGLSSAVNAARQR